MIQPTVKEMKELTGSPAPRWRPTLPTSMVRPTREGTEGLREVPSSWVAQ